MTNTRNQDFKMNHQNLRDCFSPLRAHLTTLLTISFVILSHQSICSQAAHTRFKNTLQIRYNVDCDLPQCSSTNPNASAVNFFQVISSNPETPYKTNFIWSNIGGPPMVITTSSTQESKLQVNWKSIIGSNGAKIASTTNETSSQIPTKSPSQPQLEQSTETKPQSVDGLHFNVTQDAAIGLLVEKITFFDDTDKSGLFTKDKPHVEIDWGQVIWDKALRTIYEKDDFLKCQLRMKSSHKIMKGNLFIRLAMPRNYKADRQQEFPHLKLNSQSMSIVIIADGLQPPANFTNPRMAITLVVVVQTPSSQVSLDEDSKPIISDEYTPGVFHIKSLQFRSKQDNAASASAPKESSSNVEIEGQTAEARAALAQASVVSPKDVGPSADKSKLGFLYWKEVAYTDRRKMVSRTIDVYDIGNLTSMDTLPIISQPFYQYFKYQPEFGPKPNYISYRLEMIFGKGESTYSSTNYTDFSFVFGLGAAPQEQAFSFLVKFIIFVCFCLPLLVMLSGLGYLMLRRFRRNGDTELLLAAES